MEHHLAGKRLAALSPRVCPRPLLSGVPYVKHYGRQQRDLNPLQRRAVLR
jgi:hypothetical protein